jgi:DNA polymerase-1
MTLPSVSAASVASQPPARQDARRPTILLIDGSHALFRAFFAIRNLTSPSGQPTGAVFGFTSMLLKLLRERKPERVGVCFDTSEATFRHDLDANYKANRPDMPPDLSLQWPIAQRISEELGLPILRKPGLEADDLIATLATQAHKQGWDVLIVSGDKDLMQLVRDAQGDRGAILQLDDGKGVVYDPRGVTEKWGVPPERVGDLLAIMGDSVDNVPGVRGIGEKGAVKLLQQWGTLDAIYANIEAVEPPRTRQLLIDSSASARLSRQLVELHCDADLPWKPEDLEPRGANRPALATSFAELGFKTLLKVYTDEPETQAAQIETRAVTDLAALETVVAQIRVAGRVALTAVTTECDPERVRPMSGDLVGLGLCWLPGHAVYVPVGHTQSGTVQLPWADVQRVLGPVLEDAGIAKVGHAGKYETLVLRRHGVEVRGWKADSQLASYLYEPERYTHTLRNVAFNRLQVTLPGDEELLGKGKAQIGWDAVPCEKATAHVAMRAALTLAATDALQPLLDETNVRGLYDGLELPLQDVLADMEFAGIRVDAAELGRQGEWLAQEIAKEEAEIHELAGEAFHIGSPQKLGVILFEKLGLPAKKKTQTGWSTDSSVLDGLADHHPIAQKVLRWRQLSKLKSTYTDMLPTQIDRHTGRVHTCYQQAVAATGRLSSTEPNLQNIPIRTQEGRRIRTAFIADPGCVLMSADYSQIELRVMAHLAHDPGFAAAFQQGLDIHRETAALVFQVPVDQVTGEMRSSAKAIVFGILYGMGSQRLGREIGVSLKEAKAFIERYFQRFPGVKAFVERTLEDARQTGEVRTLFGRRRPVPGLSSASAMERAAAERVAVNTPVQGTAADLIKRAMIEVHRQLHEGGYKARLLLQVHDELVLEVPLAEVQAVASLVREAMVGAAELSVPLQVDLRHGANWAEAH